MRQDSRARKVTTLGGRGADTYAPRDLAGSEATLPTAVTGLGSEPGWLTWVGRVNGNRGKCPNSEKDVGRDTACPFEGSKDDPSGIGRTDSTRVEGS